MVDGSQAMELEHVDDYHSSEYTPCVDDLLQGDGECNGARIFCYGNN